MMKEELIEIGEDLMAAIGESWPPVDFQSLEEMIDEIEQTGQPYGGDAMFSVCAINAKRIENLIIKSDNEQMGIQYVEDCMSGKEAFSDSSIFAGCVTSLEGQMKEIALHIHYPECWDTMAYPTLASAITEITYCDQCTHNK